jgi:hypothetical protein
VAIGQGVTGKNTPWGDSGGSYGAGTLNSPIVTQPANAMNTGPAWNTTIVIQGNLIGEDKWVEDNLIPAINQAGSRNVKIQYAT